MMSATLQSIDGHIQNGFSQRVDLESAACRNKPIDFFTIVPEEEQTAKEVCQGCEVRWECLSYALTTYQRHGIWGGLSSDERRLLIRRIREEMTL